MAIESESTEAASTAVEAPRASGPAPSLKRRVVRNTIANWIGFGTEMLVAFVVTGFLVQRMGKVTWGEWGLIGSLAGYMGMLDFGFKNSVGRFVAFYRGRSDHQNLLRTINTAVALLCGVGICAMGLVWLGARELHLIFPKVAPEHLPEMRHALQIVGVNLALGMVMFSFDATLWGYERFDLMNFVDCGGCIARGAGAIYAVTHGYGLVGLAWNTLFVTLAVGVIKAGLCYFVARPLRFSPSLVQFAAIRELAPFGFWHFLMNLARTSRAHLNPVVIGYWLGPAIAALYFIAGRLLGHSSMLLVITVNVLAPTAATLVGEDDRARQQRLVIRCGRVCSAYAVFIVTLLALTGRSLITLWVGADLAEGANILTILIAGECLPLMVHAYNIAVMAAAKQRPLAMRGIAECIVGLAGGAVLGSAFGLTGFAVAFALAAAWFRGVFMLRYAGGIVGFSMREYLREAVLPAVARGAVPAAGFAALVWWHQPATWVELIAYVSAFTIAYSACVATTIIDAEWIGRLHLSRKIKSLLNAA